MKLRSAITALVLLLPASAAAAPGDIDRSFGTNGVTVFEAQNEAAGVVAQGDGSIVSAFTYNQDRFGVRRVLANGRPDPSFGSKGFTSFIVGKRYNLAYAKDVDISNRGEILVAGRAAVQEPGDENAPELGSRTVITRLNSDGTLDEAYGSGGRVLLDIVANGYVSPDDAAIDGARRLLVVGLVKLAENDFRTAVFRLTADGRPDRSFADNGRLLFPKSSGVGKIVAQADGSLYMLGGPAGSSGVLRFTEAGRPDTSFGTGGFAAVPLPVAQPFNFNALLSLTVDDSFAFGCRQGLIPYGKGSGKILVGARVDQRLGFFRLTANGTSDHDFGQNGFVQEPKLGKLNERAMGETLTGVARLPDGHAAVAASIPAMRRQGNVRGFFYSPGLTRISAFDDSVAPDVCLAPQATRVAQTILVRATVTEASAVALTLVYGNRRLGARRVRLKAGTTGVRVPLTAPARAFLRTRRATSVVVQGHATDASGKQSARKRAPVTVRR